jgi:pSer/pThr/pTyr-binding forkhead associated (FHA) protein
LAKLQLIYAGQIQQEFELSKSDYYIGRQQTNEITIDNRGVSGKHAVVQFIDGEYVLKDLESTNGTKVNGKKVSSAVLKHGDKINLFKHTLSFVLVSAEQNKNKQSTVPNHSSTTVDPDATIMLDSSQITNMTSASKIESSTTMNESSTAKNKSSTTINESSTIIKESQVVSDTNTKPKKEKNNDSFKQPMLEVTSADEIKKVILSNKAIIIGKKESCDIHTGGWFFTPAISAVIKKDMSGKYTIKPETSISVNDIKTKEKHTLKNGDRIVIKNTVIMVML